MLIIVRLPNSIGLTKLHQAQTGRLPICYRVIEQCKGAHCIPYDSELQAPRNASLSMNDRYFVCKLAAHLLLGVS